MDVNKRKKFLLVGSIIGLLWTIYLFYNRNNGHFSTNDIISIFVVIVFAIALSFYFKRKWERENE